MTLFCIPDFSIINIIYLASYFITTRGFHWVVFEKQLFLCKQKNRKPRSQNSVHQNLNKSYEYQGNIAYNIIVILFSWFSSLSCDCCQLSFLTAFEHCLWNLHRENDDIYMIFRWDTARPLIGNMLAIFFVSSTHTLSSQKRTISQITFLRIFFSMAKYLF